MALHFLDSSAIVNGHDRPLKTTYTRSRWNVKAEDHRQAAEDIEVVLPDLTASAAGARANRVLIESYYGAAFHWIALKCQAQYGKHKENHTKLVSYLRDLGEPTVAERWRVLEEIRNGGWYGHHNLDADLAQAQALWQEIRLWAHT